MSPVAQLSLFVTPPPLKQKQFETRTDLKIAVRFQIIVNISLFVYAKPVQTLVEK